MGDRASVIDLCNKLGIENLVHYPNHVIRLQTTDTRIVYAYMFYYGSDKLTYFDGSTFRSVKYERVKNIKFERK